MAQALRRLGFETDLVLDPDRATMERAIRAFGSRARSSEAALFFYAGHAVESGGKNFLIPVTAQIESERDLPFDAVDLDLLASQIDGARTVLIFLDACRDNPFSLRLGGGGRGLATRGLAPPAAISTGTLIAFATAPGQTAADGSGSHSPFTAALLDNIEAPGLEVRQFLSRVRKEVREATAGRQVPWESSSLEGEFYFRRDEPAVARPAPPPPPPAVAAPALRAPPPESALAVIPRPAPPRASSVCEVRQFWSVEGPGGAKMTLRVAKDGGDCGSAVQRSSGLGYGQLWLTTQPSHGTVVIEGSAFRYRPAEGFVGPDRFIISTSPPGSVSVDVSVVSSP